MTAGRAIAGSLRILHLRNSDLVGGPERLILDECAQANAHLEPIIASFVTRGGSHPFLAQAERQGVRVVPVDQRGSFDLRLVGRVASLLDSLAPDVVVGHDYKANLLLERALRRSRSTPRVAFVHGYTAENAKIRFFEHVDRRHLRTADAVVAVSDAMVASLRTSGVSRERLHVVHNAIDVDGVARAAAHGRTDLRAQWGVAPEESLVLALGRLSPEKGVDVLLDAFAQACARGIPSSKVVLVGDGASRAALEVRAQQPDLAGRVVFAGWRDDPWACLGAADLFALPSHREGMPLALLEAMAAGVSIVATAVGAVPDVLAQGHLGILVEAGDSAALADALHASLTERESSPSSTRLQAHVRENFSVLTRAGRLASLYADLAHRSSGVVASA